MKKVIFGTALASMALLSACSSDNELANVGTTANNAIGFHVVGNKAETRANIINSSEDLKKTDFNVYAYIKNADGKDGSPFMGGNDSEPGNNGINISYKSGNWSYTKPGEIRYWPTSDTELNFYAVNPGSNSLFTWKFTNTQKEINYICYDEYLATNFYEEDGTKKKYLTNKDAMYAVAKGQTHETNNGKVKFTFKHILSQVVFKAKTQYDNDMEVDINAVSIHNFQTGGKFTIPEGAPAQSNWSPNGQNHTSGFTVKKVEEGKNIKITNSNSDNAKEISDGPMLFVPQKLTEWAVPSTIAAANTAQQSYLKITCKIKQGGAYLFGNKSEYEDLYVPFKADWQPGKRYIYTLIFGGGYNDQGQAILQPINYVADVDAWDGDNTINSNIDM